MYVLFAIGVLIAALLLPWHRLTRGDRSVHAMRHSVSWLARRWLSIGHALGVLRVTTTGDQPGAGLVVANHPSLIDAIFCWALLPDVVCVLKAELARYRLLRVVADGLGYVSNADPEQLLKEAQHILQSGGLLLVFPEGTRTPAGGEPVFRTGAAEIALRAAAPIHTLVIGYDGNYLKKGVAWSAFPKTVTRFDLHFENHWLQPATSTNRRQDRRALTQALQAHFRQALGG